MADQRTFRALRVAKSRQHRLERPAPQRLAEVCRENGYSPSRVRTVWLAPNGAQAFAVVTDVIVAGTGHLYLAQTSRERQIMLCKIING